MSTGEYSNFDPFHDLAIGATHLDSIRDADPTCMPFYDIMSDALIWPDEQTIETPTKVIWALRMVRAYRTSLILNATREEFVRYWEFGKTAFPRWVGFRPERRVGSPELLQIYRRGDISVRKCLRDLEHDETET